MSYIICVLWYYSNYLLSFVGEISVPNTLTD